MSDTVFEEGDRVRLIKGGRTGTVKSGNDPAGWVGWLTDYGFNYLHHANELELIPDTVTVTVELPREWAEAVKRFVNISPRYAKPEEWQHSRDKADAVFSKAVVEALESAG